MIGNTAVCVLEATIKPGLVAVMMEAIHDSGCKRASFVASGEKFTVMAAVPDNSVLFNGSIPAQVSRPGGFTITENEFNLMRSPSMANASITYDGTEQAHLSYGGRNSWAWATPFKGTQHRARNLLGKHDADAVINVDKMIDKVYERQDKEEICLEISQGRITVNGIDVGSGANGKAVGRYKWKFMAIMLNSCQHATDITLHMEDHGAMTLLCTEEIMFGIRISHV